jgi:hypothetical protein
VHPALEIGEAHRDGLDALLVGQVLLALLADLVGLDAIEALLLGGEVALFELVVGDLEEVTKHWVLLGRRSVDGVRPLAPWSHTGCASCPPTKASRR